MFGPGAPLRKYFVENTTGGEALRLALTKYFPDHLLELGSGSANFRTQIAVCPLDKIRLWYGRYERAFALQLPDSRYFIQGFPIRGSGETVNNGRTMNAAPQKGAITEPGEIRVSGSADLEHHAVLLDPEAVSKTLGALCGISATGRLILDFSDFASRRETRLSRGLVKLLAAELDAEESIPSPLVIAELEQAILVAFLCGNSHNYSGLLDRRPNGAAPWQLRRVEEYIEANWDQPISIEALAVVANASARSIFHSFKVHRRYSPMNFVKQVRLRHAKEMLSAPASGVTVTTAAFACGFGNLGHFAMDYQRAFGEAPSATLHRAKLRPRS